MSRQESRRERAKGGPKGGSRGGWVLAAWFAAGLVASVPAFLLGRQVFGGAAGGGPVGGTGGPPEPVGSPAQADYHVQKAAEYVRSERSSEAYEELQKAARVDPTDPRPHKGMAEILRTLDYDQLAEEHLRKAMALDPGDTSTKVSLSMVLCEFGKNREALDLLEEVLKVKPEDAFVWAEIAINTLRLGKPRDAIPLLERYNQKVGKTAWGYENLGRALAEAGELERAEASYREAIAIDPKSALAHLWLGQLLLARGRRPEAEDHLKAFRGLRSLQTEERFLEGRLNRNPGDLEALVRLAQVRAGLGKYREALVPLERALKLSPQDERLRGLHDEIRREATR